MASTIIFDIGSFYITYYNLVYVLGTLVVLFSLLYASRKKKIDLKEGEVYDLVFILILGLVIGARIFHVIFWKWSYYSIQPSAILKIWNGGLSFHGGLFGTIIAGFLYSWKKKISPWKIADVMVIPVLLFLALGRIANFINQEIIGIITNTSWCVIFDDYLGCRHPVQIYGAIGRFALFLFVMFLSDVKKWKDGFLFWISLFLLGIGRFLVDFLREDILHFGLKSGQWLSLPMIIISCFILLRDYKKDLGINT